MNKKNNVLVYVCIAIFGIVGIYLTFISGNTNKYDSKVRAYKIDSNEHKDSDGGYLYSPIYYFQVNDEYYKCETKSGSSSKPDLNKNIVYYDSKNPEKCKTEYEKSTSRFAGIICLAVTIFIVVIMLKKPSKNSYQNNFNQSIDMEKQVQIEENVEKALAIAGKIGLIIKRIIIGTIIGILLIIILFESIFIKQTIQAKDYIDTTAVYVETLQNDDDSVFTECTYSFEDKKGNKHEIVTSCNEDIINIKYDENNPQEFFEDGQTYEKNDIMWYGIKVIILILLIALFFNKKLLGKMHISLSVRK